MRKTLHPETVELLTFFGYKHLPPYLQEISGPFCRLARKMTRELDGVELRVCLRKLLESKDCALRARQLMGAPVEEEAQA